MIIDKNNHQQTGTTNEIMKTENLKDKWLSFGWNVQELDGHNVNDLLNFFNKSKKDGIPNLIVANTIKEPEEQFGRGNKYYYDNQYNYQYNYFPYKEYYSDNNENKNVKDLQFHEKFTSKIKEILPVIICTYFKEKF